MSRPHRIPRLRKTATAHAVRLPLTARATGKPEGFAGSCLYHAEIGRRVLLDVIGIRSRLVAGDFLRPLGNSLAHTYTLADGHLSFERGAYHVWIVTDDGQVVDFASWEAPVRVEREGGAWTGPRPEYVWSTAGKLQAKGYRMRPDAEITRTVVSVIALGANSDLIAEMTGEAVALAKACLSITRPDDARYHPLSARTRRPIHDAARYGVIE